MFSSTAPRFAALIAAMALTALTLVGPAFAASPKAPVSVSASIN